VDALADFKMILLTRTTRSTSCVIGFVVCAGLISGTACLFAQLPGKNRSSPPPQQSPGPNRDQGITVLFLGDSLSLCGFGKRLDQHFREVPEVKAVFTYMTCATQPLSWLKEKPYTNVKTRCGYWSIESVAGSAQPKEFEDVYGMRRGYSPKVHPVPKLEDLLAQIRPDILVMQTGGNLFDLFPGRKTVRPDRDGPLLKKYVVPFFSKAISQPSTLKKFYWVAPPTSGRVSKDVQDFIVDQLHIYFGAAATVIDSRALLSYPYHHLEPDHEHFIGEDMNLWADKVFALVNQDLSSQRLASLKPLSESLPPPPAPIQPVAPAEPPPSELLNVSARLVFKSKPMRVEELMPYQESLVGFVYDVRKVAAGQYAAKQILVMHPAHIHLAKQSLRKYRVGHTYKLRLRPLEGTAWDTVKRKDDSGLLDLDPYIRVEDETKYSEANHTN
jgi:hypothetical protein